MYDELKICSSIQFITAGVCKFRSFMYDGYGFSSEIINIQMAPILPLISSTTTYKKGPPTKQKCVGPVEIGINTYKHIDGTRQRLTRS
jgi:hypothetical protein